MTWEDRRRPASFRGVPFKVEARSGSGGRRVQTHEYPLRDKPFVEDLGRKARQFSVSAYLIGDDYDLARVDLITALEQFGPGLYVDPWGAEHTVSVESYSYDDSRDRRRQGDVQITFIEAGEQRFPSSEIDTAADTDAKATAAIASVKGEFDGRFSLDGLPGYVETAAKTLMSSALDLIETVKVTSAAVGTAGADLAGLIAKQRADLTSVVRGDFSGSIINLVQSFAATASPGDARVRALSDLKVYGQTARPVITTTATRFQEAENQSAIINLVRRAALIEEARATTDRALGSFDEAIAIRSDLAARFDAEIDAAGAVASGQQADDEGFVALTALRAAVVQDITRRGADLARIIQIELPGTVPALVVSYARYSDATRDAEIIAANDVVHPGFIPPGSLSVLNG